MGSTKPRLKTEFSIIYESILKGEEQDDRVWEKLFLIKVNVPVLEEHFSELTSNDLISLKTLSTLVKCVWRKDLGEGFRAVDVLVGFDQAEKTMSQLIEEIHKILIANKIQELKYYALLFLKILCSASDNVSQNTMVEYLMLHSLWYSLCKVLVNPSLRSSLGTHSLSLLAILLNYRKNEYSNPYHIKVSGTDDELLLNGFGEILLNYVTRYNSTVLAVKHTNQATYTEYLTSWFWTSGDENGPPPVDLSLLLSLYEIVHLNRTFTSVLTQV
eukprot:sb/3468139/